MGLSGCITRMTPLILRSGFLRACIPLFTLKIKEIACPVHFMPNEDELFCPTITLCFGAKPMNTVDYKMKGDVMGGSTRS